MAKNRWELAGDIAGTIGYVGGSVGAFALLAVERAENWHSHLAPAVMSPEYFIEHPAFSACASIAIAGAARFATIFARNEL